MILPIVTVLAFAIAPENNIWPHLFANVLFGKFPLTALPLVGLALAGFALYLVRPTAPAAIPLACASVACLLVALGSFPGSIGQTILLMTGAGLLTIITGTAAAWLVTMYRFPGRAIVDRLLVIPLAMPTYIIAYAYVELLDYAGPLQTFLRHAFGFASSRDYWFPEIRSIGGAVFVMASVLYPYVYLTARASFVQQSVCALEVARTLGRTPLGVFWAVALPLARPALVAGVSLVLMECLNDIGAVEYLGVQTLTASVYSTWLERSNLGGAAQIAAVMLGFIVILFAAERMARGSAQIHHTTGRYRSIPFQDLSGWKGYLATLACAMPFLIGFLVPVLVLLHLAWSSAGEAADAAFYAAAYNSFMLSAVVAVVAIVLALTLGYAKRVAPNGFIRPAVRVAGLGYAVPGTVLALGLLIPLAGLDNAVDSMMRATFGISTGLILSGSIFALVIAYSIRFLAVGLGTVEAGLERISPNLDAAARALGETALSALMRVHLPLLLPALGSAGLLVFVDAMKELPATLLLRPFNFDTLATHVYSLAALEQFEEAALGALTIVLVGLVPVLLLHKAVAGGRPGR
ncbi:MAG: iron ABC transporter permease [Alphaproteobacteria bacterium]|nr:iron ABC transporter permease [Alphaproteobacteria bacterium]